MIKIICRFAIVAMYCLSLGIQMAKHGQPKDGEYNALTAFSAMAIMLALMYGAGTFTD
jgi:hypothetical protein